MSYATPGTGADPANSGVVGPHATPGTAQTTYDVVYEPSLPSRLSDGAKNFLRKLLIVNMEERVTKIDDVFELLDAWVLPGET